MLLGMSYTVVGTFERREDTEAVVRALTSARRDPMAVQVHVERLDTLDLPDSGTEVRRNVWIANVSGVLLGGAMGAVGAVYVPGLALDAMEGFVFGGIVGFFTAYITALMSGTRDAKVELRELQDHLEDGGVIVSVDTGRRALADEAAAALSEHGADVVRVL